MHRENPHTIINRFSVAAGLLSAALAYGCSGTDSSNDGSGGMPGTGGSPAAAMGGGGATSAAGASPAGGQPAAGGANAAGSGNAAAGSASMAGGAGASGGMASIGGAGGIGGASSAGAFSGGGATATGGSSSTGGGGTGGTAAAGGGTGGATSVGPCDIYATANTPCVAAHSTVRALYKAYSGALYQLRRASDKTTKDVPVQSAGGFVDISVQDTFCSGTTCTISIIYDQSSSKNDLVKSGLATWLKNGGVEANAANGKITVGGHTAHGIYVTQYSNVAYRNNATKGVAKGDQAEAMYMVVDGKRYSSVCCFDYGNAETSGKDDGNGTMEAVYWGTDITWGGTGQGSGPWIAADLENGMFKGNKGGWQSQAINTPGAKSISASFATAMLKGPSGNMFTLKAGDAQTGSLVTMWDGVRPSPGYSPKKLQGAIILGTGGDGSNGGTGTFFEGAMTIGNPPSSVDELIQANIVAAGYGH